MSVKDTLKRLNNFMKGRGLCGTVNYRGEVSHLMRAANSAISLNTSEKGSKFFIELQDGKKFSRVSLSAGVEDYDKIVKSILLAERNIDVMPEIPFATPMKPICQLKENIHNNDAALENIDSAEMLDLFKGAKERFPERETVVSGAFSCGSYEFGVINTLVENPLYHKGSDFNIEIVLQLIGNKKEIRASQVGDCLKEIDYDLIYKELESALEVKKNTKRIDIEPGSYDVVFGRDAVADLLSFLSYLGLSGEAYEYGMGMFQKKTHKIEDKIFGDNFSFADNPEKENNIFSRTFGTNGIARKSVDLIKNGVLKQLIYSNKMDCDRFNQKVNNDDSTLNPVMETGEGPADFKEMVESCKTPTIFIPYLHYMNSPNRAKGEVTATSRFGTFLIEDGKIKNHLYKLRINEDLFKIFSNIEWLSRQSAFANTSDTYGLRMASAVQLPIYTKVKGVNITGSSNVA